ncbi:MAG: COG4223 family protein, partial [Nitrobacter sp.]
MVDDKHDDASQEGSRPKRSPPTIDLEATEISRPEISKTEIPKPADDAGEADKTAEDQPQPADEQIASPRAPSQKASIAMSAITGAVAAACVVGGAWFAGWPASSSIPQVGKTEFGDLSNRVAGLESKAAKPQTPALLDPAVAKRIDALEKSIASLREELATVHGQSDKLAAALKDAAAAPRDSGNAPDLSGITARLAQIEQATKTLSADVTKHDAAPADDAALRRVVAATLLNVSVRNGEPYAELLAASKSLVADPETLKPLEAFASSGVPHANTLCRELLAMVPKLTPAPATAAADGGIVNRLQESAARLVRIERTDGTAGDSSHAVIARITTAALHNDVAAAKRGLNDLPPAERAAAQPWIAKADARDAA